MLSEFAHDPDAGSALLDWAWRISIGDGQYDDGASAAAAITPLRDRSPPGERRSPTATAARPGPKERHADERITSGARRRDGASRASQAGVPFDVWATRHADGDDVTITWYLDHDGQFDDRIGDEEFKHTFPTVGLSSIAIRVEDADEAFAVHRIDVAVSRARRPARVLVTLPAPAQRPDHVHGNELDP